MEKKEFIIIDGDKSDHLYNIVIDEIDGFERVSLNYSNHAEWNNTIKDKTALSYINTGDSIRLNKKIQNLDYAQLFELRLLLNFEREIDTNEKNKEKSKVIENKTLFEI